MFSFIVCSFRPDNEAMGTGRVAEEVAEEREEEVGAARAAALERRPPVLLIDLLVASSECTAAESPFYPQFPSLHRRLPSHIRSTYHMISFSLSISWWSFASATRAATLRPRARVIVVRATH